MLFDAVSTSGPSLQTGGTPIISPLNNSNGWHSVFSNPLTYGFDGIRICDPTNAACYTTGWMLSAGSGIGVGPWAGKDWGMDGSKLISIAKWWNSESETATFHQDGGSIHFEFRGSDTAPNSAGSNGDLLDSLDTAFGSPATLTYSGSTAYRYHWIVASGSVSRNVFATEFEFLGTGGGVSTPSKSVSPPAVLSGVPLVQTGGTVTLGAEMLADVQEYADLGPHRSGSTNDRSTMDWMQDYFTALRPTWRVVRSTAPMYAWFDYQGCDLVVDGEAIECFGVWLPTTACINGSLPIHWVGSNSHSDSGGTHSPAPLTSLDQRHLPSLTGKVALIELDSTSLDVPGSRPSGSGLLIQRAIDRGAAAVLVINRGGGGHNNQSPNHPKPTALDAPSEYSSRPWAVPVLVVGREAQEGLRRPGARIEHACVRGQLGTSETHHLLAMLNVSAANGSASNTSASRTLLTEKPRKIIVTTSTSGWFRGADEHGTGVALFRALGRALPTSLGEHNVEMLFMASSGDEVGEGGVEHFIEQAAALDFTPAETTLWLSLDSTLVTSLALLADSPPPREDINRHVYFGIDFTEARLWDVTRPLASLGFHPRIRLPDERDGHMRAASEAGYAAIDFFGHSYGFHTANDNAGSSSAHVLQNVALAVREAIGIAISMSVSTYCADDLSIGFNASCAELVSSAPFDMCDLTLLDLQRLWPHFRAHWPHAAVDETYVRPARYGTGRHHVYDLCTRSCAELRGSGPCSRINTAKGEPCDQFVVARAANAAHGYYFLKQQAAQQLFIEQAEASLCEAPSYGIRLQQLLLPLRWATSLHVLSAFYVKTICTRE